MIGILHKEKKMNVKSLFMLTKDIPAASGLSWRRFPAAQLFDVCGSAGGWQQPVMRARLSVRELPRWGDRNPLMENPRDRLAKGVLGKVQHKLLQGSGARRGSVSSSEKWTSFIHSENTQRTWAGTGEPVGNRAGACL